MNSIDFSRNPPVVHNNCEGCDLCWCICPVDAIEIPNIAETHALLGGGGNDGFFFENLAKAEASGRFRRLTPLEEVGWDNIVYNKKHAPRVILRPENYPYHVEP
jgi:Fe-S-cluster-containing hydrogenase component 2